MMILTSHLLETLLLTIIKIPLDTVHLLIVIQLDVHVYYI